MRFFPLFLVPALLFAGTPLGAQNASQVDRRIQALESQMRAVQRQVFPGGDKRFFAPEITAPETGAAGAAPGEAAPPTPAESSVLTELTQRVTALETQQRAQTGQIEELQFQLKQLQQKIEQLEQAAAPPAADGAGADDAGVGAVTSALAAGAATGAAAAPAPKPAPAKPADLEAEYRAGYALYTDKKYAEAEQALTTFAEANPKHARASNAEFWAARSMLAQGRTADAAKAFLAGYQKFPQGQRAHNSLLWLAKTLIDLKQPTAACQALDQLKSSYPKLITGQFKTDVDQTVKAAKCSG